MVKKKKKGNMCACWLVKDRPANTGKKEVQTLENILPGHSLFQQPIFPNLCLESFY